LALSRHQIVKMKKSPFAFTAVLALMLSLGGCVWYGPGYGHGGYYNHGGGWDHDGGGNNGWHGGGGNGGGNGNGGGQGH
jgi:hypothetical protein